MRQSVVFATFSPTHDLFVFHPDHYAPTLRLCVSRAKFADVANTRFVGTRPRAKERASGTVYDAHFSAVLWLTFLVYSTVSSTLFQTWACKQLDDGGDYLRADAPVPSTMCSNIRD